VIVGPATRRLRVNENEVTMRFVQAIILLAFLGAVGLFALQNTEAITVTFWTWKASAPVALLTIAAYLLGMVSGWTVVSFVTRSLRQVSQRPTN
jgi:lipopolysaccharide assembly protein A